MADIKLFNISGNVKEYKSQNVALEKELQPFLELNFLLQNIQPHTAAWTA